MADAEDAGTGRPTTRSSSRQADAAMEVDNEQELVLAGTEDERELKRLADRAAQSAKGSKSRDRSAPLAKAISAVPVRRRAS